MDFFAGTFKFPVVFWGPFGLLRGRLGPESPGESPDCNFREETRTRLSSLRLWFKISGRLGAVWASSGSIGLVSGLLGAVWASSGSIGPVWGPSRWHHGPLRVDWGPFGPFRGGRLGFFAGTFKVPVVFWGPFGLLRGRLGPESPGESPDCHFREETRTRLSSLRL